MKKLSSQEIEFRMEKLRAEIVALDKLLARHGEEATLSLDARSVSFTKHTPESQCVDATIWLGRGIR